LHVKGHHDFGTSNFAQAVVEHALRDGSFDRQLTRVRALYLEKMRALHETLLAEGLASLGWSWREPSGGLYLWLQAPGKLDTGMDSAFCRACVEGGVLFVPGDLCFGDEAPRNFLRLSFGVLCVDDLREAGRRFVSVARKSQ
jgi:2-aminoadipate transaminase